MLTQNTVNGYRMEGSGTNVALGMYGANMQLSPALTQQRFALDAQLSSMSLVGGPRQMSFALNSAAQAYGRGGNNRKVYVMFAAGNNAVADNASFKQAVNGIISNGNEVVIVALGNSVNMAQFQQVITSSNHLFHAFTLNGMPDLLHSLLILNMPVTGIVFIFSLYCLSPTHSVEESIFKWFHYHLSSIYTPSLMYFVFITKIISVF